MCTRIPHGINQAPICRYRCVMHAYTRDQTSLSQQKQSSTQVVHPNTTHMRTVMYTHTRHSITRTRKLHTNTKNEAGRKDERVQKNTGRVSKTLKQDLTIATPNTPVFATSHANTKRCLPPRRLMYVLWPPFFDYLSLLIYCEPERVCVAAQTPCGCVIHLRNPRSQHLQATSFATQSLM
jgi:hypothetical protein